MTVVYAALSSNLNINGSAIVQNKSESWNIHFAHIDNTANEVKTYGYATAGSSITLDNTTVTVPNVTLKAPGDKVEYIFKVVNEGDITGYINVLNNIGIGTITYDVKETLTSEQRTSFQNDIQVTLTYNDPVTALRYNDYLEKDDERELILTIQYANRVSEQVLPSSDVTFTGISATIAYGQDRTSLSGSGDSLFTPQVIQKSFQTIMLNSNSSTNNPTSSIRIELNSNNINPSSIVVPEKKYMVEISDEYTSERNSTGVAITNGGNKEATYIFEGWYTDVIEGDLLLSNTSNPTLQSNVTGYTDANGNWIKDDGTTLYARFSGTGSVTLPSVTKTGYKCGWTANESDTTVQHNSGTTLNSVIADVTLYPVCELGIYTVTLDNQSATTAGTTTIYEKYNTGYYKNSIATTQMTTSSNAITVPTKTGYTFGGYYTSTGGSGTQYIDENGKITSSANTTNFTNNNGKLYAKWTEKFKGTIDTSTQYSTASVVQKGLIGVAYLDPTNLKAVCNAGSAKSTTGTKQGCMKFYIYAENSTSYTMILDHNTTATVAWNTSGNNSGGPVTVNAQRTTDTAGWEGTTRLITAQEVANITGTSWNASSSFYFEGSAKSGKGTSAYAWLFDRTRNCTSYGCNVADSSTHGYWTSSPSASSGANAWMVYREGMVGNGSITSNNYEGLRPVLTISKSDLGL